MPRGDLLPGRRRPRPPHPRRTTARPCWQGASTASSASTPTTGTLAAAVTNLGGVLAHTTVAADAAGYQQLPGFAHAHLPGRRCWAVEGAGSFGAGLAVFLQQRGEQG